jgi:hypothetical protein
MIPIRRGDGTGLSVPGFSQVRTGDGRVLYERAIPDSVVTATPDNSSSGLTGLSGMQIESTVEWHSIGVEISANTSGVTLIEVFDASDGTLMGSTSTSSLSGGDTATIDNVNLQANTPYHILASADGASWTRGWIDDYTELPKTSSDGQLTMVRAANGPTSTGKQSHRFTFSKIGNVGFA